MMSVIVNKLPIDHIGQGLAFHSFSVMRHVVVE